MIVVLGSLSGDHLVGVKTLPKPGETRLASAYALLPGGKGANQAVAAAKAGGDVIMCGSVGDDPAGAMARRSLESAGVRCDGLRTVAQPTGLAFVWVEDSAENMIIVASGANGATRAADAAPFLRPPCHALVQMEVPVAESWQFLALAHARGCTTVCNLAPAHPVSDAGWNSLDVLIVNEHEAASLTGGPTARAPLEALARERDTAIIMTEGAAGATAFTPSGTWHVDALSIEPVDTTGAGDAFVGALVARRDGGASWPEALRYASAASGLACLARGAQEAVPTHQAVVHVMERVTTVQL